MAPSTAKKTAAASASSRLTVMPLFLDQHGTMVEDENGETITVTCYAEHCGVVLVSDQPMPGSKKARTLVSKEDFWKAGWEKDDDDDPVDPKDVDPDEVEKFVIDPFKTTKQDLEEQFGKRYLFIAATWGDDAPEGKSGLMKGTGHSFFTGGDTVKKRGLPVEEKPKKKSAAAPESGAANDDEPETPEETIERLEEEAAERDEKIEALEKKFNERAAVPPAPAPSFATQMKETVEVMNAVGHGPQAAGAAITQQREQWWQEQLANERQQSANALQQVTRAAATDLSTLRGELTGLATAASIRYEGTIKELRDDGREMAKLHTQALADERAARVKEIERRDTASEQALSTLKTLLAAAEVRLSDLRYKKDDEVSKLTGDGNVRLLESSMATMHLNIEREKTATLSVRATTAEAELTKVKGLLEEQRETTHEMKRALAERATGTVGNIAEDAGFRIPPIVMKMLAPVGAVIVMLIIQYFLKKGEEMPPEVKKVVEDFKNATKDPHEAAKQANARRAREEDAAAEATRAEDERQTRQRSADYEEEQRQQKTRDDAAARVAEERRKDDALRAERAKAHDAAPVDAPAEKEWKPGYGKEEITELFTPPATQ